MKKTESLAVLGSTGSIGTQALEVARERKIKVEAISAASNIKLLEEQIREFAPSFCHVFDEAKGRELALRVKDTGTKVIYGDNLSELVNLSSADTLLTLVVGIAGLLPTLAGIEKGMKIALANKETLVTAGELVTKRARERNVPIIPVDSEHCAVFQSLLGNKREQLKKIILTASGGPFFGMSRKELEKASLSDALAHPNWSMGAKITVDSATLMNKGLEVIEARWLFDTEEIDVVVHRESVIHSMVEYIDNSIIAQLGTPSMKLPIQFALTYPDRFPCNVEPLDFKKYSSLSFYEPDTVNFPLLKEGFYCMKEGGSLPVVLNAANEAAVDEFLKEKIRFNDISDIVCETVEKSRKYPTESAEDIIACDREARIRAYEMCRGKKNGA